MSSLTTDLPNMNPLIYTRGNQLRREVAEAKGYAERYPGSAAAINAFLSAAAGVTGASVTNGTVKPVLKADGTSTGFNSQAQVTGSTFDGMKLSGITGLVSSGQTFAVTGGTVTVTVAANVVTMSFTATP